VFALRAAASFLDAADVVTMHVFCVDWAAWDLVVVHLTCRCISWIESTVQFLQQAMSNALAGGGLVFGGDDCVCFAGGSLVFGCGRCGNDACFFR